MKKARMVFIAVITLMGISFTGLSAQNDSTSNKVTNGQHLKAKGNVMATQGNKQVVYKMLKSIFEDYATDGRAYENLIAKNYIQWADGQTSNYNELLSHFERLHKSQTQTVNFITLIEEGDIVFSRHVVTVYKENEPERNIEVFAEWTVINGLIEKCREVKFVHKKK